MRVAIVSDLQLRGERLDDAERSLEELLGALQREEVDELVIAGDVFQHRRPAVDELVVFRAFLESVTCGVIVVAGNHDVRGPHLPATVDVFRHLAAVFTRPEVCYLAGAEGPPVALAVLPWAHPGPLRAGADGGRDELADALLKVAEGLFSEAYGMAASSPGGAAAIPVLVTHHALDGAQLPGGQAVRELMSETILDTRALLAQGWRYIFAGHIHVGGVVLQDYPGLGSPAAYSVGVPWRHDFGEEHLAPGFLLLDTTDDLVEKRLLPDRPFVTLEADLTAEGTTGLGYLDVGLAANAADVTGAIVRVRIRATEEQAPRVSVEEIRRGLFASGALDVRVLVDVERTTRARLEGQADELEPLQALEAWLAANALLAEGDPLRELTKTLLEKIR